MGALIRRRDVCEALGVSKAVLKKMVECGTLRVVRVHEGARAHFYREQVMALAAGAEGRRHEGRS
jgi:excisionase family DNA binding protein